MIYRMAKAWHEDYEGWQ